MCLWWWSVIWVDKEVSPWFLHQNCMIEAGAVVGWNGIKYTLMHCVDHWADVSCIEMYQYLIYQKSNNNNHYEYQVSGTSLVSTLRCISITVSLRRFNLSISLVSTSNNETLKINHDIWHTDTVNPLWVLEQPKHQIIL